MADIIVNPGSSVQAAITAALPNDRILLAPGTHNSDTILTINKALTLMAQVPGSLPNLKLNGTTFAYLITFSASNITIDGLDIDNTRGGGAGFGYGFRNTLAISNITIQNCKLHHFRRAFVGNSGQVNGFNLLDSQVYQYQYTPIEIDNAINVQIKRNWIYQQTNTTSGEAAVTYYVGADAGTSEISYNYIYGSRFGVEVAPTNANSVSTGSIVVAHNTIDMNLLASHASNVNSPYCGRYGTSFWTGGANKLNGINIAFRDNLISRLLVYGMYFTDSNVFLNAFEVKNCLFFDNYWYYWPSTGRYPYEFFGHLNDRVKRNVPAFDSTFNRPNRSHVTPRFQRAITGHNNPTDQQRISYPNCIKMDPFFELSGTTPPEFYALKPGSPAIGAASDGTNIGAWQG